MPPTFDLLVIGDANPDVIVGPLDSPLAFGQREQLIDSGALTLGGSAAITACGAARLGLRVAFAGRVGDDGAGHYMRDRLAAHGVDVGALHLDKSLPTPLTVIVTRGADRAIVAAAAELLAHRVPLVAVKNGADGALCHDGRTLLTTAGVRVTPVDAVGAGDSFNAGFLAARLAGRPIAEALDLAAACGALSTRAAGGTTAQPTWDEALTHLTANGDTPS
ncbi:carbohydrate kinase family protein [Streptomyces malaysiensis]|uniref:Carbohydrate kinase n=1 Tax=Streptomyces malaysiensis TaxID=92644 RepID=A0A7X6B1V6_STRMQ|nr:carbohydrate kinase family protein [Streptomyces malaysiensis]NIY70026.1 carbohydrate kinase [Streptomyces malaysiensis]